MLNDWEQQSIIQNKMMQHPNIPSVFVYNKNYACIDHPDKQNMNRGAMKQHIRGKKHKLDWNTGMPLKANPIDTIDEKQIFHQKLKIDEKMQSFMQTDYKLDRIFSSKDTIKSILLATYELEEPLRSHVIDVLNVKHYSENQ